MPDPKLDALGDEIVALLKKHDVAGAIILASPTHATYNLNLNTSWNCARHNGNVIRFNTHGISDPAAKKRSIETTINAISGLSMMMKNLTGQLDGFINYFARHFQITQIAVEENQPCAKCPFDTDRADNCPIHPHGCPSPNNPTPPSDFHKTRYLTRNSKPELLESYKNGFDPAAEHMSGPDGCHPDCDACAREEEFNPDLVWKLDLGEHCNIALELAEDFIKQSFSGERDDRVIALRSLVNHVNSVEDLDEE